MEKSPDAFRTISEVAELLETPAHVLRFWESRFPQIRPVKRAGGRRYYRPADVALLTGIKRLLHDDGLTIRGVQKILREQGVRHVSGVADDPGTDDDAALEAALAALGQDVPGKAPLPAAEAETAQIIALQTALNQPSVPTAITPPLSPKAVQDDPAEGNEYVTEQDEGPTEAFAASSSQDPDLPVDTPEHATPPDADGAGLAESTEAVAQDIAGDSSDADAFADAANAWPVTDPWADPSPPRDLFEYGAVSRGEPAPAAEAGTEAEDEAPMALWAEADDPAPAVLANVATFAERSPDEADLPPDQGQAQPVDAASPDGIQAPDDSAPAAMDDGKSGLLAAPAIPTPPATTFHDAEDNTVPTATLATRLRGLDATTLSAENRVIFAHLRIAARDLRQRLQAPTRPAP